MLKELIKVIIGFFDGLEVRLRWSLLAVVVTVVVSLLVGIEFFTGFAYYGSLQRKVNLLRELHALARDNISTRPELYRIYEETVAQLDRRTVPLIGIPTVAPSIAFWKFLSGSSFFLLMAVLAIVVTFGEERRTIGVVSMGILAALMGYVGTLIPTVGHPVVNYVGFPAAQVAVLYVLSKRSKRAKQSQQ